MACDLHDYIEIACLYHLPIQLTLKTDQTVLGVAQDIVYKAQHKSQHKAQDKKMSNDHQEECVTLLDDQNKMMTVALSELKSMQAMVVNPHFDKVEF